MTEYELDRWYAYQAGIDITNFPPYRPAHINKTAFEYLKKYANFNKDESQGEGISEHGHPPARFRKIRKQDSLQKKRQEEEMDMINRRKVDTT